MSASRFAVVALVAAVPLWYVYRTATDKRTNQLTWKALVAATTAAPGKPRTDSQCKAAGDLSLAALQRYEQERARYIALTGKLRRASAINTGLVSAGSFTYFFKNEEKSVMSDEELKQKRESIKDLVANCEAGGNVLSFDKSATESLEYLNRGLLSDRKELLESRTRIELVIKYANDELPRNLEGDLQRLNAERMLR